MRSGYRGWRWWWWVPKGEPIDVDKPCGVDTTGAEEAEPGDKVIVGAAVTSKQVLK